MSSDLSTSDAFGKMPGLSSSARPVSTGERSVASGSDLPEAARPRVDAAKPEGLDREALEGKLAELEELVQSRQRDLSFSVDDDSGRTVVKVINAKTDEVVRQIPSEEILAIAQRIEDGESGLIELEA